MEEDRAIYFEVKTSLNVTVRTTENYWRIITTIKHPIMLGKEEFVKEALRNSDEIRRGKNDPNIYLFYKKENIKRWTCAVIKRLNGEGFLVTAFPTDAIKEGDIIWSK